MKKKKSTNWQAIAAGAVLVAVVASRSLPGETQKFIWYPVGAAIVAILCLAVARLVLARLTDEKPEAECRVLARAASPAWLYLGALAIVCAVAGFALDFAGRNPLQNRDLQIGVSLFAFIFGAIAAFFGSFQLRIAGETLEYWSLESGRQVLELRDIERARIRIGISSRPGIRLELLSHPPDKKSVFVALKAFRKQGMERVFDWLGPKLEDPGGLVLVRERG